MRGVEKQQEAKGVLTSEARRSDSRTWVLREVWVLLQPALTPPASGLGQHCGLPQRGPEQWLLNDFLLF